MKKLLAFCLTLVMILSLSACGKGSLERFEEWTSDLGQTQMTEDKDLIGSREAGIDDYVGSYEAACDNDSGRDVIFGGSSTKARTLYVSGTVKTESGSATVRIRLNDEVIILQADEAGNYETELHLKSGGNYIMIDYSDFSGSIEMCCEYIEEENQTV